MKSLDMPQPLSLTEKTAQPFLCSVDTRTSPPSPTASLAFKIRLRKTFCISSGSIYSSGSGWVSWIREALIQPFRPASVSVTNSFRSTFVFCNSGFLLTNDRLLHMPFIFATLFEIVDIASLRKSGSSKCAGRFCIVRDSVEATFLRSWTKKVERA